MNQIITKRIMGDAKVVSRTVRAHVEGYIYLSELEQILNCLVVENNLDLERNEERAYYNGMSMRPDYNQHAVEIAKRVLGEFYSPYPIPIDEAEWLDKDEA